DSRAQDEAAALSALFSQDDIYRTTGLPAFDGYTPIAKLMYIVKQSAATRRTVAKCLLLEDFLIWKLTGEMVTEKTLLSSTGYFDIVHDKLWDEALYAANISLDLIPQVMESGEAVGTILPQMADLLGVSCEAIVITGAMDQVCGAIGCANLEEGCMHETTGTAMVIGASVHTPDFSNPYRITVYRHAVKGLYLMLPICRSAAIIQKWFKDQFCENEEAYAQSKGISVYDYMSELANQSKPRIDGPILYPYFNGCQMPLSVEKARGCFYQIGLDTTKNDIIRAIPEGIAFMLRENLEMLAELNIRTASLYTLGGVSKNAFWCQMKADVTGCRMIAAPKLESTSFGAACLAAVQAGYFISLKQAAASYKEYTVFSPDEEMRCLYQEKYEMYRRFASCAALYYDTEG
ncbi:MAG: FGGY-family carbohydrate kinase, partial [Christensenellaceae bacterium]